MNIVVLAGGLSPERDVSLASGCLVANALIENGHNVFLCDLYEGVQNIPDNLASLFTNKSSDKRYSYEVCEAEPDLVALAARHGNRKELIGPNVLSICQFADVVYNALHGAAGENGQIQATFDSFGIKYTGSGFLGSMISMDKELSKRLMKFAGILTPDWILYDTLNNNISDIEQSVGYPCFVKPSSCGSSVGISEACCREQLISALEIAGKYEQNILVEKKIVGREITVGVLDGEALPIIEIIPIDGFYDYKNKYQVGLTREICPAELDDSLTRKVRRIAEQVHRTLKLDGYSRSDFIMDQNNNFYCLEVNSLPGMTKTSLVPQMAAALGISYNGLCQKIIDLSLNKYN